VCLTCAAAGKAGSAWRGCLQVPAASECQQQAHALWRCGNHVRGHAM
jgi:hypothetical protein